MPESLRTLRRKRETVGEIREITRAMKLVAAARLKRAMAWRSVAQSYFDNVEAALAVVGANVSKLKHPYLEERPIKRVGLLLVAGDKGLCGAFNSQLVGRAREFAHQANARISTITVGSRTSEMARRARLNVIREFPAVNERRQGSDVREVARYLMSLYEAGGVDEVSCVYSRFISRISNEPAVTRLLPLSLPEAPANAEEPIFEPPAALLARFVIPQYVVARAFQLILSTSVSEHSARLVAMSTATDNAEDMIGDLTRDINRARQASITAELLDIAAGAEAQQRS